MKVNDRVTDKLPVMEGEAPGVIEAIDRKRRPPMAKVLWDGEPRGEWVYLHELRPVENP